MKIRYIQLVKTYSFLFMCLIATPIIAGPGDGSFISFNALFESGPTNEKYNIVIMGDGFTSDEQDAYNSKVNSICYKLFNTHPFSTMDCGINFYRMNIASVESGVDKPGTCEDGSGSGTDALVRTPLDASYCAGAGVRRCILGSREMVRSYLEDNSSLALDASNVSVYVLVNDTEHGGCASGGLAWGSIGNGFENTFVHELGHSVFDLADEYDYGRDGPFTGSEPSTVNITAQTSDIKWSDLILSSTSLPTGTCEADDPDDGGADIVGIFEGAQYRDCGIYRPQYNCKMRENSQIFCSVCRRKGIQTLDDYTCGATTFKFTNLLIRDDSEGWPRGDGEIYFNYTLRTSGVMLNGRWPGSSGDRKFDDGQNRSLNNFFAGRLPSTGTQSLNVRVKENDWPDGDDNIPREETQSISIGDFEVDSEDWRLRGRAEEATYHVMLDYIHIKNDQDGWLAGAGDIYINYDLTAGSSTLSGRWPSSGDVGIDSGKGRELGTLAGVSALPDRGTNISLSIDVWDEDSWFTGGNDRVGSDTFEFESSANFGLDKTTHVFDRDNYRIVISVYESTPGSI